jgi:hypothetical protein
MIRAVVEEAAALASITLFVEMIVVWAQVLAVLQRETAAYPVHGAGRVVVTLDRPAAASQDRLAGRIGRKGAAVAVPWCA